MIFRRLLGFMMGCFGCAGQPTEPKIESKAVVDDQPVVTSPRVRLSDGRFLAYRERGVPKIKSSYRIIIVHGFGSSKDMSFMASDSFMARKLVSNVAVVICERDPCLMIKELLVEWSDSALVPQELLDELGVYILIYDRAGYGESDHNPKRTLKSEASDIEELADLMQLGPKLAGVALVVPFVNYKWRSLPNNLTRDDYRKQLCQWVIWITRHARGLLHWWLTQSIFPSASVLDQNPQFFCEKDLEVLKNTPGYQLFTQDGLRSRKVFDSLCRDCNVAFGKWDFDPLELSNPYPKNESSVHIWQGYKDKVVPVELQRHVWERLPWIRYHEVPDGGHLLVYDTAVCEAILRSLLLAPVTSAHVVAELEEEVGQVAMDSGGRGSSRDLLGAPAHVVDMQH
nr:probable lysophospholipase BODYGUARD 1 [Ipomoea trifida]